MRRVAIVRLTRRVVGGAGDGGAGLVDCPEDAHAELLDDPRKVVDRACGARADDEADGTFQSPLGGRRLDESSKRRDTAAGVHLLASDDGEVLHRLP